MSEITEYYSKAKRKYEAGKSLYDLGFYSESIVHFYYSMFLLSKILLLKKNIKPKKHTGTINMLKLHYIDTGELDKKFHDGLSSSETLRNEVDYGSIDRVTKDIAREKRNICSEFLLETKRILDL